ncbi:hypothetical protein GCM10010431_35330 [Streptomyces kunmingensis]
MEEQVERFADTRELGLPDVQFGAGRGFFGGHGGRGGGPEDDSGGGRDTHRPSSSTYGVIHGGLYWKSIGAWTS